MPDTTTIVPMDWAIMDLVRQDVEAMKKFQPVSHTALLFPDCLSAWEWVQVPLVAGIVKVFSVDDVNSDIWLNTHRGGGKATDDSAANTIRIDRFPFDEPCDLDHSYSIVTTSQRDTGPNVHPINVTISSWIPELHRPWRGNLLVFKHGKRAGKPLISVTSEDTVIVKAIIKRVAARPDWKPAHRFSLTHELRSIIYLVRCRADGMFEAPELLALVLSYLPLMDLLRYGDVCKATRCQVRMLLRTRVLHYTRPFFPSKTKLFDFAASLTRLQSWIVGSVPLAVLSLCADVAVPDNLNIICGHHAIDTSDGWHTFLVSNLGFHHVETTARTVTVTAAKKQTLAELLFAAPNTSQWNAISETAVISPCVQMTSNHEGLQGWRQGGWRRRPVVTPLTASLPKETPWPTVIKLHPSTRYWSRPCGAACPA
ncbi:hypothetical protein B0H13DRAFT_1870484 [Mycena leptocephala]|nr:hypothetical protein B0H13DRAFT_1870484 [Mycena leptocephala]